MEFFTGVGIIIFCLAILIFLYILFAKVLASTPDDFFNGFMAFITIAVVASIFFAVFCIHPEEFGYQKIETVSECEVKR